MWVLSLNSPIFTFQNATLVVILQSHDDISKQKWMAPEGGFRMSATILEIKRSRAAVTGKAKSNTGFDLKLCDMACLNLTS